MQQTAAGVSKADLAHLCFIPPLVLYLYIIPIYEPPTSLLLRSMRITYKSPTTCDAALWESLFFFTPVVGRRREFWTSKTKGYIMILHFQLFCCCCPKACCQRLPPTYNLRYVQLVSIHTCVHIGIIFLGKEERWNPLTRLHYIHTTLARNKDTRVREKHHAVAIADVL